MNWCGSSMPRTPEYQTIKEERYARNAYWLVIVRPQFLTRGVAEVKSRFDPNTGGADPNKFSKAVCDLGFASESNDFSNKMFILLYFKKKRPVAVEIHDRQRLMDPSPVHTTPPVEEEDEWEENIKLVFYMSQDEAVAQSNVIRSLVAANDPNGH
ncbi:hypothetical protein EZV62_009228 [Acer yangbiense]|uniref:Ribosomal RNA-processing protein 8 n=1 Tax=Acer yangbiense TaxID=1000413 RepID=A0A5C7IFF8_9ROSI|nr:hypothetical protein EZV62_009228 [Acer yangbiense]